MSRRMVAMKSNPSRKRRQQQYVGGENEVFTHQLMNMPLILDSELAESGVTRSVQGGPYHNSTNNSNNNVATLHANVHASAVGATPPAHGHGGGVATLPQQKALQESSTKNAVPTSKTVASGSLSAASEELSCPLCLDILVQATTLVPCGHSFCGPCCDRSLTECPTCRGAVTTKTKSRTLMSVIDALVASGSVFEADDVRVYHERSKIAEEEAAKAKATPPPRRAKKRSRQRGHLFQPNQQHSTHPQQQQQHIPAIMMPGMHHSGMLMAQPVVFIDNNMPDPMGGLPPTLQPPQPHGTGGTAADAICLD